MPIEFKNIIRSVGLIDTRAEINVITLNLAKYIRFPIRDESRFINIVSQINYSREFYKVIEKVPIKIQSTINTVPIWIVEETNNKLVLGILYIHASRITQKADSDGLTVLIFSNDNKTIVRFLNASI